MSVTTANYNTYDPYNSGGYGGSPVYTNNPTVPPVNNGGAFNFVDDYVKGAGYSQIASMVSHAAAGGFAAYKFSGQMAKNIGGIFGGGGNSGQIAQQFTQQMSKSVNVSNLLNKGPQAVLKGAGKDFHKFAQGQERNVINSIGQQGKGGGFIKGLTGVAGTALKGTAMAALVGAGVSALANGVGVATGSVNSGRAMDNVITDTITSAVGGLGAVTVGGLGHMALSKVGMGGLPLTIATTALGVVGGVAASQLKNIILD